MEWKDWIGKKIFVRLNSNKVYSGVILEVEWIGSDSYNQDYYFFTMRDKFGEIVGFPNKEILEIKEER